jgi:hypothetical protein
MHLSYSSPIDGDGLARRRWTDRPTNRQIQCTYHSPVRFHRRRRPCPPPCLPPAPPPELPCTRPCRRHAHPAPCTALDGRQLCKTADLPEKDRLCWSAYRALLKLEPPLPPFSSKPPKRTNNGTHNFFVQNSQLTGHERRAKSPG